MPSMSASESRATTRAILRAGFAGALAEVVWIGLFCAATPLGGSEVLRQITASIVPAAAGTGYAPALGLAIHFVLGVSVATAFALLVWRPWARSRGVAATFATALLALGLIWTVNFFVVLPAINPLFVGLMPYGVTLLSKLLFAVAMAGALELAPQASAHRNFARGLADTRISHG